MEPSLDNLHVNSGLSDLATGIAGAESDFVALKIAPPFPVMKTSDFVWTLDTESMFRGDDTREGPDGFLKEIEWLDSNTAYITTRHGVSRFVSDVDEAGADPMVKPSRSAQRILMRRNLIALERAHLSYLTSTSNVAQNTTLTAGNQLGDSGANIDATFATAHQTPLISPNAAVVQEQVYWALQNNAQIKEKYKYTGQGIVPEDVIKQVLGVKFLFVARAKYATNDKAAAFASGYIMGKDILFFYYDPTPSKESLNSAWTFWFKGEGGGSVTRGSSNPFYVKETREPRRAGGGFYYDCEAWYSHDPYILAPLTMYLIKDAVA